MITMTDDSLDSSDNCDIWHKFYRLKPLHTSLKEHLNTFNITQHNFKDTYFSSYNKPSSIDHIYSNCPNYIYNVTTNKSSLSDHSIITANYKTEIKPYIPKFIKIRNWKLLTKTKIQNEIINSVILNNIFQYTNPDKIANSIRIKYNCR